LSHSHSPLTLNLFVLFCRSFKCQLMVSSSVSVWFLRCGANIERANHQEEFAWWTIVDNVDINSLILNGFHTRGRMILETTTSNTKLLLTLELCALIIKEFIYMKKFFYQFEESWRSRCFRILNVETWSHVILSGSEFPSSQKSQNILQWLDVKMFYVRKRIFLCMSFLEDNCT